MPLQKLQFRPGINRESTTLANEGGWFESDKVRFRSGSPEKIGGWVQDNGRTNEVLPPPTGSFWGTARALWNWVTLASYNLLGVGTELKYYIQNGTSGTFYDITPIRYTATSGTTTFAATAGSRILTVTSAGHGAQANDFVIFSGAVSLGGAITAALLNTEFQITSIVSNNVYTVTLPAAANAGDTGNGGASIVSTYQITTGSNVSTVNIGWGAGGWGGINTGAASTGWGSPAPAGVGFSKQLRLWSQENYGQDLILNPRGGAMYHWGVNANPNVFDRATQITSTNAPIICNFVMVSDASRFVLAFGVNDYAGSPGATTQNPMLLRWSDQQDYTSWTPSITNQAGSYTFSQGSTIVTALQTRQEILVWTDTALYSLQYLGPPYVWGSQILDSRISIAGPNTVATVNGITYWMGADKFYMYSGRVETLPSTLRTYVFNDINMDQAYQFFAGTNEGFNEVWWFYCSANSTTIDKYVVYNHLERIWYYGTMSRSAWLDSPLRAQPMATTYAAQLMYHETGVDDGTTNPPSPIISYVQSSDFDIGDGHNFGFVWRIIPDVTFDGSTVSAPSLDFTVRPRQFPGSAYGSTDNPAVTSANNYAMQRTYNVQQFTQQVYVRVRGRQMAFKVGSTTLGTTWQLGVPRIEIRADGRK